MDPNNAPQQNIPQVSPVVVPTVEPVLPPQEPQKSNKNLIIIAIVMFIGIVIAGAVGVFLYFNTKPIPQNSVTYAPTPTIKPNVEEIAVTDVKGASDLDSLLVDLEKTDNSLQEELVSLGNDSNF